MLLGIGTGPRTIKVPALQDASVQIRAVNEIGAGPWSIDKTATPAEAPEAPTVLSAPAISGTATQGQTLTATAGSYDGNPAPTVTRQWLRDGAPISGATGLSYQLQAADVGATVTLRETATNGVGSSIQAVSNGIGPVVAPLSAPSVLSAPAVSGEATSGQTRATGAFAAGETGAVAELSLPAELRNRVTRFEIEGLRSAGAVSLTDDSLRRREIALLSGQGEGEGFELLSPLHYLRQALAPNADLLETDLNDMLLANPDVLILADVARLSPAEEGRIEDWVEKGGLLLRFAGPRMAASDVSRAAEDPLMPVRLREGGRSVGGAMTGAATAAAPAAPRSAGPLPRGRRCRPTARAPGRRRCLRRRSAPRAAAPWPRHRAGRQ